SPLWLSSPSTVTGSIGSPRAASRSIARPIVRWAGREKAAPPGGAGDPRARGGPLEVGLLEEAGRPRPAAAPRPEPLPARPPRLPGCGVAAGRAPGPGAAGAGSARCSPSRLIQSQAVGRAAARGLAVGGAAAERARPGLVAAI